MCLDAVRACDQLVRKAELPRGATTQEEAICFWVGRLLHRRGHFDGGMAEGVLAIASSRFFTFKSRFVMAGMRYEANQQTAQGTERPSPHLGPPAKKSRHD